MDTLSKTSRFQLLVVSFMLSKPGVLPFEPKRLDDSAIGASHGERCIIQFILNLWRSDYAWKCGTFDVIEALSVWDEAQRKPFIDWATDPWWP